MKKFLNFRISENNWLLLTQLKNVIFALLIVIDFLFIIIITFYNVSFDELYFMSVYDLIICALLFMQLIYDYLNYKHGFKSFIREHLMDIFALIPFNFIFLRYLAVFRIARLLQFLQVFKILNINKHTSGSLKFFIQNGLLKVIALIVFLYLMFSSVALKEVDPAFNSVFDAFWFNLVTITSVGYGDLTPLTSPGKIIAMFSIFIGIMFVSVFTAAMAAVYMQKPEEDTRKNIKDEISGHMYKLKEENDLLHEEISYLKDENEKINKKLDKLLEYFDEGDSDL